MAPRTQIKSVVLIATVVLPAAVASALEATTSEPNSTAVINKSGFGNLPIVGSSAGVERSDKCKDLNPSRVQPPHVVGTLINKCCPSGQFFNNADELLCVSGGPQKLQLESIFAVFYGESQCIDKTEGLQFQPQHNDLCENHNRTAYPYGDEPDQKLFIIQNGSLLVIAENDEHKQQFELFNMYCVDMVQVEGGQFTTLAKVCDDDRDPIVLRYKSVVIYTGAGLAAVILIINCWAHAKVPQLNDAFGYLVVLRSGAFLIGMIAECIAVLGSDCELSSRNATKSTVQRVAHICLVTSTYALFLMCAYIYTFAAYYLPKGMKFKVSKLRIAAIFLGALYPISIVPLFQSTPEDPVFQLIMCVYYVVIAVTLFLTNQAIQKVAINHFIAAMQIGSSQQQQQQQQPKVTPNGSTIGWTAHEENGTDAIDGASLSNVLDQQQPQHCGTIGWNSFHVGNGVAVADETNQSNVQASTPSIDVGDLRNVNFIATLCKIEAALTAVCWLVYYLCWLSDGTSRDIHCDFYRIRTAYAIIFQGALIGVLYMGLRRRWTRIYRYLKRTAEGEPQVSDRMLPADGSNTMRFNSVPGRIGFVYPGTECV